MEEWNNKDANDGIEEMKMMKEKIFFQEKKVALNVIHQ